MFRCVIVAAVLTTGYSLTLESTQTDIIPKLAKDVTLQCSNKGPHDPMPSVDILSRIQILRMNNINIWKPYAHILSSNTSKVVLTHPTVPGIFASGHLGQANDSFITITWSKSFYDSLGSFKCVVDSFPRHGGHAESVESNVVKITNSLVSQKNLLDMIIRMQKESDNLTKELKVLKEDHEKRLNTIMEEMQSDAERMRTKTATLSNELRSLKEESVTEHQRFNTSLMRTVKSTIKDVHFSLSDWPIGDYSLPMPIDGCPDTPSTKFIRSHYRIRMKTNSKPAHQPAPHQTEDAFSGNDTDNVLTFSFCRNHKKEPRRGIWPKGSYCINWSDRLYCPLDFKQGTIAFYPETLHLSVQRINTSYSMATDSSKKEIKFYVCCRNDGDVDTPIILPNSRPFYLQMHRNKGKCQTVFNTHVYVESLHVQTDVEKTDGANGIDIKLCYYSKL